MAKRLRHRMFLKRKNHSRTRDIIKEIYKYIDESINGPPIFERRSPWTAVEGIQEMNGTVYFNVAIPFPIKTINFDLRLD